MSSFHTPKASAGKCGGMSIWGMIAATEHPERSAKISPRERKTSGNTVQQYDIAVCSWRLSGVHTRFELLRENHTRAFALHPGLDKDARFRTAIRHRPCTESFPPVFGICWAALLVPQGTAVPLLGDIAISRFLQQ